MSIAPDLQRAVELQTPKLFGQDLPLNWESLPGDASNRRYVRIHSADQTRMLMILNAPEAFKSEEKTGREEESSNELDFVRVGRAWKKEGIRVPRIDYVDPENRFLLCEDFGDELLYLRRQKEPAIEFYKKALNELLKVQDLPARFPFKKGAFTYELLRWEFQHFFEYALEKRQLHLTTAEIGYINKLFDRWSKELTELPQCVVHRDFHSKNLMILKTGEIGLIDFQDALMGPDVYDLASLLRDSYVRLSDDEERELVDYFSQSRKTPISFEAYSKQSIQRNLKAVGRFFYISMVKGKDTHLPFVRPSMLRILKSLEEVNEPRFAEILRSRWGAEI